MATNEDGQRAEYRHVFRTVISILAIAMAAIIGGLLVYVAGAPEVRGTGEWIDIAHKHFPAVIGLPAAAFGAICVVLVLEVKSGRVEFELWGLKLKGASGEVVLFVIVFLSFALAIKVLW